MTARLVVHAVALTVDGWLALYALMLAATMLAPAPAGRHRRRATR